MRIGLRDVTEGVVGLPTKDYGFRVVQARQSTQEREGQCRRGSGGTSSGFYRGNYINRASSKGW